MSRSTYLKSILHYSVVGRRHRLKTCKGENIDKVGRRLLKLTLSARRSVTYMIWQNAVALDDGLWLIGAVDSSFDNFVQIHVVMMALI